MKKKIMLASAATVLGLTTLTGFGLASAQSSSGKNSLIDKLAQRFNLNKADVQKVFDEDHAAHEAEREQAVKNRLDQAVKAGQLTQVQEDKIIAKLKELKTARDVLRASLKDKTAAERREALKSERDQLKKWAADNNVPVQYLLFGRGHDGHDGPHPADGSLDQ